MLDWTEITLRLSIATLAGGVIGLNRDLHGKPIGLKTLAVVSLATAMLLVLVHSDEAKIVSDAGSRVMQGILTGIGFVLATVGAIATIPMNLGPAWYPIALALTAWPCGWLGGSLYLRRQAAA